MSETVMAAGGVIWRLVPAGPEVLLVHRPAYDDWAFAKGKASDGETGQQTAQREVLEETGLTCRLGPELPTTTYVDLKGQPKTVRYWAMTVVRTDGNKQFSGHRDLVSPQGQNEVDAVCWVQLAEARAKLTYPRDVVVLDDFEASVLPLRRVGGG